MIKATIQERINNYMHKNYDIEWIDRTIIIRSKVKVSDLIKIRTFLKSNGINYKNIIIKGDKRCWNYLGLWEVGNL